MTGDASQVALRVAGVTFAYGRARPALSDLTLRLAGGPVALLGPNGAGKSTLIRLLSGAVAPQTGTVMVGEHVLSSARERKLAQRRMGVLPQGLSIMPRYTCEEFLRYVAWLRMVPPAHVDDYVVAALRVVELESFSGVQIRRLSGGMRQRLGLAQAVVNIPNFLVLDEPTNGLDPQQRVEFRRYMQALGRRCLVVFATHLVEDVAAVARDVVVIADGTVRFAGSLSELAATNGSAKTDASTLETAYVHLLPTV